MIQEKLGKRIHELRTNSTGPNVRNMLKIHRLTQHTMSLSKWADVIFQ